MPAQPAASAEPAAAQPEPEQPTAAKAEPVAAAAGSPPTDGSVRMTPAVRRLVREHGIDISQLTGSGAGGRVTRDDVLAFIERGAGQPAPAAQPQAEAPAAAAGQPEPEQAPAAAAAPAAAPPAPPTAPAAPAAAPTPSFTGPTPVPAPAGGDTEMPLTQMRKGIATKMTRVKQTVPHAYTVVEVDVHNVVRWREANQAAYKAREGIGLSYVAAVVKAVTETLRQHPTVNSQFAEDKIILKQAMNIGIAVAVDNGLLVPVIHDADQLSISGVNMRIQDLAARARTNKLKLDEIQGGTFTVNNTGWFGSVSSMPIVNAPEVAILSMEAIVKRPVVIDVDGADSIAIRPMMNMTCSFDHRVLDGAQVGAFLSDVRKRLEEWDPETPIG
jgi:2-oxoisovalerate dehydrogenase E2 component (dihydrolipoyl transacylase)